MEAILVEVWTLRGSVYCWFVFAYSLNSHQILLLVEQSSVELIAAHLRLHAELRCCDKCSTILPNSPLAVDAPDAHQHRCSSLVISRSLDCSRASQTPAPYPPNNSAVRLCTLATDAPNSPWKRFCEASFLSAPPHLNIAIEVVHTQNVAWQHSQYKLHSLFFYLQPCSLGFSSAAQYQQHLKNVHNKYRFVCPECRKSPEYNIQHKRQYDDSLSARPQPERLCHLSYLLKTHQQSVNRHIRLVHQTIGRWSQEETTPTASGGCIVVTSSGDGDGTAPEREQGSSIGPEHGYLLCMAPSSPPLQHRRHVDEGGAHSPTSLVVADISVEPPPRRPKKTSNTDTNSNVIHKHWDRE
ncbi:unnamed protein product [Taenia asiatica]|uniref:C2H2-type domain-containing protein n=1 Tax=Taenia asiatica TaxID=60517 RepID=A0A0R3W5I3_TAEAS|nr:unnamed protein product [Taenia asiatica]